VARDPVTAYRGTPVLVTGGQGFIGTWLVERLLAEGAHVVVPCRGRLAASRFRAEGIDRRCTIVQGGAADKEMFRRILAEYGIRAVFHLAAQPIVGIANRSPHGTFEANIRGTYTLLEACREAAPQIERIVVASSDHAYGPHEAMPFREDFALQAEYPYDVSKMCTDIIARSYADSYRLPLAVTRFANVYGGGDPTWSRIVPDTVLSLVQGRAPVIRSDGTPRRDYMYVEDAVEAYLAIADSLDDERHWGKAWNAGHGEAISVREIVDTLVRISGTQLEPVVLGKEAQRKEMDLQYLDASRIRDELGWRPRWTLRQGLESTYRWYEAAFQGEQAADRAKKRIATGASGWMAGAAAVLHDPLPALATMAASL
jgi:CDP-glucose 4,6-dehydratase